MANQNANMTVTLNDRASTQLSQIIQRMEMINARAITAVVRVNDRASNSLASINNKLNNFKNKVKKSFEDFSKNLSDKRKSFYEKCSKSIVGFAGESIAAAQSQQKNEMKLASTLKLRTKATGEQIDSILKLTSAQQQNGVVSDEVQMAGAEQLASYAGNTKSIEKLIPAMNNLMVHQKGLNGTSDDAVAVADLMGQGLKGQTNGLKEAGLAFSEAEENVLKYGTEEERAAMLAKVISQNVGEANAEMANTDAGAIQQAQILFGELKEQIGNIVLPYLAKFAKWFTENQPQIKAIVDKLGEAVVWVVNKVYKIVDKLYKYVKKHPKIAEFIKQLLTKFKEFAVYLSTVIPPILKKLAQWFTTTILPVLKTLAQWLVTTIFPLLKTIGGSLLNLWNGVILPFIQWLAGKLTPIFQTVFPIIKQYVLDAFSAIGNVIVGALQIFHGIIDFITGVFTGDWSLAWQGVLNIFDGIFSGLAGLLMVPLNAAIGVINEVIKKINSSIQFDIPDWVPELGGKHLGFDIKEIQLLDISNIQKGSNHQKTADKGSTKSHKALGTSYWKGGLTYINERGGEIVDLPNGSKVIPADKSKSMLNGGNVSIGNIYITAKGVTANEVVNEIVPQLKLRLANM